MTIKKSIQIYLTSDFLELDFWFVVGLAVCSCSFVTLKFLKLQLN